MNTKRFVFSSLFLAIFILLGFFALQSADAAVVWHPGMSKCQIVNGVSTCHPPVTQVTPVRVAATRPTAVVWHPGMSKCQIVNGVSTCHPPVVAVARLRGTFSKYNR